MRVRVNLTLTLTHLSVSFDNIIHMHRVKLLTGRGEADGGVMKGDLSQHSSCGEYLRFPPV